MWIKLSRNNEVPEPLCQRSSRDFFADSPQFNADGEKGIRTAGPSMGWPKPIGNLPGPLATLLAPLRLGVPLIDRVLCRVLPRRGPGQLVL